MKRSLRYLPTSLALGTFIAVSYLVCSLWDALLPGYAMRTAWEALLPGFTWWSWGSFALGLVESFAYGFWLALLVPLVHWLHHTDRDRPERDTRPVARPA